MAKREAILVNTVTTLGNITVPGGYNNNIGLVTREPKDWVNLKPSELPAAWALWAPDVRESKDVQGHNILSTLTLRIRGIVYAKTALETELNKFTEDVEKAMMVDETRGGNAMYTNPGTVTPFRGPTQYHLIFDFDFEVKYQYLRGSP